MKFINKSAWISKLIFKYEDGTGIRLAEVLKQHPTNNMDLVQEACSEIDTLIGFFMSIITEYWHAPSTDYKSTAQVRNRDEFDFSKWMIDAFNDRILFYPDSQPSEPYYAQCLNMYRDYHRVLFFTNELDEEETNRVNKYGIGYRYVFAKLLDGYSYK